MEKKQYIIIANGGSTYSTDNDFIEHLRSLNIKIERMKPIADWKYGLQEEVGNGFDVLMPRFPCSENAKYDLWKIIFDKTLEKIEGEIVLVGHSLGGIFLVKYLTENDLPKKAVQLHLVATPFNNEGLKESIGGFKFNENLLQRAKEQVEKIFIYQSKDDPAVPFSSAEKYQNNLSNSELVIFEDRGHFKQKNFPELANNITK